MSTFTGTPTRKNIRTSIDLIAQLIDVYRLPGEGIADFKERVLDTYIHSANATYPGLYNGVNRELGLEAHAKGILIDIERDADGSPLNTLAGVEISSKFITLYSNHAEGTVQKQIDLRERGVSYFVSELNTQLDNTSGFESVLVGLNDFDKSMGLQRVSSLKTMRGHQLVQSRVQNIRPELLSGNFLTGDVLFSVDTGIDTEVVSTPSSPNEFMVDYNENIIFLGKITTGTVTFQYQQLPLFLKWSPITINSFKDSEFMDLITQQVLDEDHNTIDGLPTPQGAEYINELLSVAPQYWGE